MDQVIAYNVEHHESMGVLIAIYFFLSGLGAGAFLIAAVSRIFGGGRYARLEKTASIAAPILILPGMACLVLDLGKPFRMMNLFLYFNPSSVASWGAWIISIFVAISVLYAFLHIIGKAEKATPLAYAGFLFALAVGLYSGVLLYQMRGYELWHSALVPVIFLASAIASGLAVVLLLSHKLAPDQTRILCNVFTVAIGIELVLALTEVVTFALSGGEKAEAANVLLSGNYGLLFVGLYLILGLVLPLAALLRQRESQAVRMIASLLVLIGTFAMRYVIVMGGQALPLS